MFSERRQTQKVTYCKDSAYMKNRMGKSRDAENRLAVARGWEWLEWGVTV